MEANFLVGSGISKPSGLADINEITNSLLEDNYFELFADESIIKGEQQSDLDYSLQPLQDFLSELKRRHDQYLVNRIDENAISNYEDLYYILDQLRQEKDGILNNFALQLFVENIEDLSVEYRSNYKPNDDTVSLGEFCDKCMALIDTVIKYSIWDKEVKEMDLLVELDNNDVRLNIFSLNHDTLIEKLFTDNDIPFEDGYSRPDNEIRWYQPEDYDLETQNKIYHLHGCRSWKRVRITENGEVQDRFGIMSGEERYYCKRADGSEVRMLWDKGYILIGTGKASRYHYGMFEELQFRFAKKLRSTHRLIVSGYGWNDYPINRKVKDWVLNNSENKLMIVHNEPQKMVDDSRYLRFDFLDRYSDQLELREYWFGDLAFDDVMKFVDNDS